MTQPNTTSSTYARAGFYTLLLLLITLAADGFSGKPTEGVHQLAMLPVTGAFLFGFWSLMRREPALWHGALRLRWTPARAVKLAICLQCMCLAIFFLEVRHYSDMGYRLRPVVATILLGSSTLALVLAYRHVSAVSLFCGALACYLASMSTAILSFPLNYLRSDMLPVIVWANTNLLHHISPYTTMYVGARVYDFPYLPGMLLAYTPAVALHLDLRIVTTLCVATSVVLIFFAAATEFRLQVAALLALFLTCPYLQYRHEIYNQPHWLSLVVVFVLMQRRRFVMAALAFGVSMAIYQFSWIMFPFLLLNAWRRRGWLETGKLATAAAVAALSVVGPFLRSAFARISSNTVGQWGLRTHADAEPINLSYWLTFLVSPGHLLRVQALLLVGIFLYCCMRDRCRTFADTLRWMLIGVTTFILLNVLVDGYFYLMLLIPLLIYTCVANGWWREYPDTTVSAA